MEIEVKSKTRRCHSLVETSKKMNMLRATATRWLPGVQRAAKVNRLATQAFSSVSDGSKKLWYNKVPKEDFGQYTEYSVIFTNRALNLMSDPFQKVMRDLNDLLKYTYNAHKVAIIPGYVAKMRTYVQNLCPRASLTLHVLQVRNFWYGVCCETVCHK